MSRGDLHTMLADNARAPQWQPIETAPKDGTGVLLIDMTAEAPEAGSGWYVFDFWTAIDPCDVEDDRQFLSVLVWDSPTHWMPLPDPPGDGQ